MQLEEFFDYKNQLMEDLLTNKKIVELINDSIPFEDARSLAYSQVFPCEYIPTTADHGKTFVCFDVDIQRSINKTYVMPVLYIWVFTHGSKLRLEQGGVRTDALCSEIAKAINGSHYYGLGELDLYSVKRFAPMTDFPGKVMMFETTEFNRLSPVTDKPIPGNRKRG